MAKRDPSISLAELSKIAKGAPLLDVLTADRLNAIQDAIKALVAAQPSRQDGRAGDAQPKTIPHPFWVYPVGYADAACTQIKVECSWGTICNDDDANSGVSISALDNTFTLQSGHKMWLDVDFDEDGVINACTLKSGVPAAQGWTNYPQKFEYLGSATYNNWRHPIAEIRAARTGKASTGSESDRAEYVVVAGSLVIAQLTNTHLTVEKHCGMDASITQHWRLVPGPGVMT